MSGFRIEGSVTGNLAEVTNANEIKVITPLTSAGSGYASMTSVSDAGGVTGNRYTIDPECSSDYKQRVALDTFLMNEFFPGTVLNSNIWTSVLTTMTTTVANGFVTLNAGLSTAGSAVARLQSYRCFPVYGAVKTYFETTMQFAQLPVANNVCEWGLGFSATTVAPTDGAFFRLNQLGEFRCVVVNNSVELQSDTLDFSMLVSNNVTTNFIIALGTSAVHFWINDVLVHVGALGTGGSNTVSSCNLPINFRNYNFGVTASAQVMKVANVNITFADNNYTKGFPHQMSGSGASSYQTQTGAATHGQTSVWANGANPVAAAPTATTAALGSGLGGIFIANINALAVTTDFIIQSYQVPLGTAVIPGKSLYITGVKVSGVNTVAANGAALTTWAMALAYGHNAVSLATTETVTSKTPRRIPLGVQSLGNAAPIGSVVAPDLLYSFVTPVCVQPGEFVQTILRFIVNTSVATQAINFYITFEGYFE